MTLGYPRSDMVLGLKGQGYQVQKHIEGDRAVGAS